MKKTIAYILTIALLLCFPISANAQSEQRHVFLYYVIGSSLEDNHGYASLAINSIFEGLDGTYTPNKYVFRVGGAHSWDLQQARVFRGYNTDFEFFTNSDGSAGFEKYDCQSPSMGDPDTLADFLERYIKLFDDGHTKFSLVLWDHGNGPNHGFGADYNYGSDSLTTPELAAAMKAAYEATNTKLELVNFYACNMSNLETAQILSPYANYMIASQDSMWYSDSLKAYTDFTSGSASITDIGKAYISEYSNDMIAEGKGSRTSLAMIDLSKISSVTSAVGQLGRALTADITDAEKLAAMLQARGKAKSFGARDATGLCLDIVDVWDWMDELSTLYPTETAAVKSSTGSAVTCFAVAPEKTNAHGICLYSPCEDRAYMLSDINKYMNIDFNSDYQKFVKGLYENYYMKTLASELKMSDWAAADVQEAFIQGILNNLNISTYTKYMLRIDCATLLVNLYEYVTGTTAPVPSRTPFVDTDNTYALKAYALGITKGTGAPLKFFPNDLITRQDFATMVTRFLDISYRDFSLPTNLTVNANDSSSVSDYAYNSIAYLQQQGIIKGIVAVDNNGTSQTYIQPHGLLTIEQGIVICERLFRTFQGEATRSLEPATVTSPPEMMAYANYLDGKITIVNYGTKPISLGDCYMEADLFVNRFVFPDNLVLEAGQRIYVLTGYSANGAAEGSGTYIWTKSMLFSKELNSYTGKIFMKDGTALINVTKQLILEAK